MIFILGSPRTGSTLIYQIMINVYNLFYFTNLTNNYFYKYPFLGSIISRPFIRDVGFESDYGKTKGLFGPSEGSYIFKNWFGEYNEVFPSKKNHLITAFVNINKFINKPIVIKNAWNCFRIRALRSLIPDSKFIWIRRNIIHSANSDLKARYNRGGPYTWNSSLTYDYKKIQKKPYYEQVVEQQYSYNKTIENDLKKLCPNDYIEIWYEDICKDLNHQLKLISNFLKIKNSKVNLSFEFKRQNIDDDFIKISNYVEININKFNGFLK